MTSLKPERVSKGQLWRALADAFGLVFDTSSCIGEDPRIGRAVGILTNSATSDREFRYLISAGFNLLEICVSSKNMPMSTTPAAGQNRPFLSIHFRCCNVYTRIYPNAAGEAFVGWCPRCAAPVRVPIVKSGGSTDRVFTAG